MPNNRADRKLNRADMPGDAPPATQRPSFRRWWTRAAATWRLASNVEQAVAFWDRIPSPIRRAIAAVAQHWASALVALIAAGVTVALQRLASVPVWALWLSAWFTALGSHALLQVISVARRWKTTEAEIKRRFATAAEEVGEGSSNKARRDAARKAWLREAEVIIPRLPDSIFSVLSKTEREASYFANDDKRIPPLVERQYIHKRITIPGVKPNTKAVLYELNRGVRSIVCLDRDRRCSAKIRKLDKGENADRYRAALDLFADPNSDLQWPLSMSQEMFDLYESCKSLYYDDVLESRKDEIRATETFSIAEDYKKAVLEIFLGREQPIREAIEFDLSSVPAQNPSWYSDKDRGPR